jgi:hypothetical protein
MKAAFSFAGLGVLVTGYLASQMFGWEWGFVARGILAANLAGFISLFCTLWLERRSAFKKGLLKGNLRTWAFLSSFYLIILLGVLPEVREVRPFFIFFLPLLLTTGFMMPLFGKAQDWTIAREQRRAAP